MINFFILPILFYIHNVEGLRGGKFPSFESVRPCGDLPEVCQRKYFAMQKEAKISRVSESAQNMQNFASSTLSAVKSLKTSIDEATAALDADSSRSNGGQIRDNQLFGVVPYMSKLSAELVKGDELRYQTMSAQVQSLLTSVGGVTKLLVEANKAGGQELFSTSEKIKSDLTSSSLVLKDLLTGIETGMIREARQFDTGKQSGPKSVLASIKRAIANLNEKFSTSKSKMVEIQTQFGALVPNFDSVLNSIFSDTNLASQLKDGEAQSASMLSGLKTESSNRVSKLLSQLRAVSDEAVPEYIGETLVRLTRDVRGGNALVQKEVTALNSGLKSVSRFVGSADIANDLKASMGESKTEFEKIDSGTQRIFNHANAITARGTTSFGKFQANLELIWKLTKKILTGQTKEISQELLDRISRLTQAAGREVNRLDKMMIQASSTVIQSDESRQAILKSSRTQVESMIGSNQKNVEASFKKIQDFLKTSKRDLAQILGLVQLMAGAQAGNLGATSAASMDRMKALIDTTKTGAKKLLSNLSSSVLADMASDFKSLSATNKATNGATAKFETGTKNLLKSVEKFPKKKLDQISASRASLAKVLATSKSLAAAASPASLKRQATQLATELGPLLQSGANKLGKIQADFKSGLGAAQKKILTKISEKPFALSIDKYWKSVHSSDVLLKNLLEKTSKNRAKFDAEIADLNLQVLQLADSIASLFRSNKGKDIHADFGQSVRPLVVAATARLTQDLDKLGTKSDETGKAKLRSKIVALTADWKSLLNEKDSLKSLGGSLTMKQNLLQTKYSEQITSLLKIPIRDQTMLVPLLPHSGVLEAQQLLGPSLQSALREATEIEQKGAEQASALLRPKPVLPANLVELQKEKSLVKTMAANFDSDLNLERQRVFSKTRNVIEFKQKLNQIETDLGFSAKRERKITSTFANTTSELVLKFGDKTAREILAFVASLEKKISKHEKQMLLAELLSANIAYNGSAVVRSTALASAMENYLAGARPVPRTAVDQVSVAAPAVARITASQLAAIVALYSSDSKAAKAALAAQLAAEKRATASVQDALAVWQSLASSTISLTENEVENLVALQTNVIDSVNSLIPTTDTAETLSEEAEMVERNFAEKHAKKTEEIAELNARMDAMESEISDSDLAFSRDVNRLQSVVNKTIVPQLQQRLEAILGQRDFFSNSLETAVMQSLQK